MEFLMNWFNKRHISAPVSTMVIISLLFASFALSANSTDTLSDDILLEIGDIPADRTAVGDTTTDNAAKDKGSDGITAENKTAGDETESDGLTFYETTVETDPAQQPETNVPEAESETDADGIEAGNDDRSETDSGTNDNDDLENQLPPEDTINENTENLTPVFSDVSRDDWFYDNVEKLYNEKIIIGYPDGSFLPEKDITVAEFIKILVVCTGEDPTVDFGDDSEGNTVIEVDDILFPDHWASDYINAAFERGIISEDDLVDGFDLSAPISRSDMTRMLILALDIDPVQIDNPFTDISDIYANTAFKEYLLRGYPAENEMRSYNGDGNAKRSEAATIAVRAMEYLADPYGYKKNQILENAADSTLMYESELIDLFHVLNREFIPEFTFRTTISADGIQDCYRRANVLNVEYFYSSGVTMISEPDSNEYTLRLKYDYDIEFLKAFHSEVEAKSDEILSGLFANLPEPVGDREKIKAIHDYLILNCEYDYSNYIANTIPFESYTAHGALIEQRAVCQGYCSAFNLLCRKSGIRSAIITGKSPQSADVHSWNMVLVDDTIYYVDVTNDDPLPDKKGKVSYTYYMLTESEMDALDYQWDKSYSNLKYFY